MAHLGMNPCNDGKSCQTSWFNWGRLNQPRLNSQTDKIGKSGEISGVFIPPRMIATGLSLRRSWLKFTVHRKATQVEVGGFSFFSASKESLNAKMSFQKYLQR
ncbi:MAG: hypothetical protein E3K33_05485 [Candidatus Brocadia sp.]|jgi:hypothetical protein|nr:hypothetical protein [Candidatus Brocadia sp.]